MTGGPEQFVGRTRELAELAAIVRGRRGVVLVAGEAGVGKSRLVAEAVREVPSAVAWGSCWDGGGAPAFWPWTPVIRTCLASVAGRAWRDGKDSSIAEVVALLPEEGQSALTADASRFRLFEGVTGLLRVAAGTDGLVVVLDDLQWADEASLRLFGFAARGLFDEPVVLVGTYRDDEIGSDHPVLAVLAELAGRVRHLHLSGLDADDLAVFARSRLAEIGAVTSEQVGDLHRLTGGNPFFAREVLALVGSGQRGRGSVVPAGVRAVIERRLARLSNACDDALRVAAVVGTSFSVDVVAGAMDLGAADVLALLGEALEAQVVVAEDGVPGGMRFVHDLLRETVYGSMAPASRVGAHARVAAALATRLGSVGAPPATVAHHLIAAVPLVERGRAAEAAVRAGDAAMAVFAHEEAGQWFERSLSLLRSGGADETDVIGPLLGLGEARLRGGDLPGARDAYVEAAGIARRHGRSDDLALAALGLGAGLGGFEVSLFDHVQIELLEEALDAVESVDSARRVQLLARLSVALSFVSEERRLGLATEAVAMARRLGDRSALGYALAAYCDAIPGPASCEARREAATEVVSIAVRVGDRRLELLGRRLLLAALLELGEIAEVDAQIRAFSSGADAIREPLYRWYVPLWRGMRALMAGRVEESSGWCDEAEAVGALAHSANASMLVLTQRWVRLRVEGRVAEAARLIDEGLEVFGELAGSYAVAALTLFDKGDLDAARSQLRAFVADLGRIPMDAEWLPTISQLAELAAGLGDRESAAVLDPVMAPFDDRVVVEGIGAAVYGTLGGFRASLVALLGREDESRELAGAAAATAARMGLVATTLVQPTDVGRDSTASDEDGRVGVASRDGDIWTLTFAGRTGYVRDSKGLRDLTVLLASPGVGVHVRELVSPDTVGAAVSYRGDEALDRRAIAEYRRRLSEMDGELDEAEAHHDEGRTAKLATEREFLLAELAGAVGLGGRVRRMGDDVDRARKAVRARVRDAITRIEVAHPELGRHLARAVRTGIFCSYDAEVPVRWTVRP
jgi:AAA ATPase domain